MTFGGNNNYDALLSGLGESGYSSKPKVTATGSLSRSSPSVDLWDYSSPTTTQAPTAADYAATQGQGKQDDATATLAEVTKTLESINLTSPVAKTYTNTSQMDTYMVNTLKDIGFDQYFGASGEIPDWLTKDLGTSRSI